ncbi:hypothetical protein XELAEV_18042850mg [Xenopus laevis]|uniref:Ig-like domain-containing protein n=1 Tax=Xenopus laevis TaxID=8355 RepID=A0A974C540_XENLA|nr:hypothetical protein XELAEV_18042850mg [Xenopus laevis]
MNNFKVGEGQTLIIRSARPVHSGGYNCETDTGGMSDVVQLDVSFNFVILQVPSSVHEGDSLSLRCHCKPEIEGNRTIFYKNGEIIKSSARDSVLDLGIADENDAGLYECKKSIYFSGEAEVFVTELFTVPQIKINPHPVIEGDHMTITCDTKLSPHRETTELQFAFYRNGHNVQGFSSSNQYGVPSAQLEDSGNYTCEVQTPSGSVRKRSRRSYIWVQGIRNTVFNSITLETINIANTNETTATNHPFPFIRVIVSLLSICLITAALVFCHRDRICLLLCSRHRRAVSESSNTGNDEYELYYNLNH